MESEGAASATAAAAEIPITSTGATGIEFDEPTDSAEDNKLVIFEVVLKGGAPWGFSLKGGSEQRCPITIAKIEPGGKAYQSGNLQCDDQILAVNEVQCDSHHEAIQLVKSAFNTLHLSVIRGSPNDYKHGLKSADYYHSSAHIYSSKDMHPQHGQQDMLPEPTKTAPSGGGVTRRLKKRDSTNSPRPKSWHNAEASQHWKEREFNQQQQQPQPVMQQVPRPMPQGYGYPAQQRLETAPSMDSLMTQGGGGYPTKMLRGPNTQSMMSLHYTEKLEYSPEYMKKSLPEFGSAQDMNYYTKEREFASSYYGDKRAPFLSVNPAFRRVDLSPAETYPKVAVATQLQNAQQRAFIGRVPSASEIESQEKHVQTFTTSRTVSYATVQMPQRQYASTADFQQPQYNNNSPQQQYPGYAISPPFSPTHTASSYSISQTTPQEQGGDKKVPPPLPVRGESRSRTLQISEHMKSSSWPATTESSDTFNSEKPTSVISPTDLPPVKLSPSQEYPQRKSSSNSSSSVSSIPMEYHHGEEYSGPTSPNPGIYTAKPYYIEDSTPDMDSWFNKDKDHNQRYSYSKDQNPPSPPTRDIDPQRAPVNANRRERRTTKDSLTGAYQSYLEEMLQQEECLKDVAPSEQAPPSGHSSTAHSPDPLSQTAPSQLGLQQRRQPIMEERLNRTAALSQEAVVPLTVNTSSANQWTEERNKKNNLMGQMNERTWQSPDDFKKKSEGVDQVPEVQQPPAPPPVDEKEEEWKRFAQKADSEWESRQQKKDDPQSLTHKRELSEIDEKSLTENAPRMRSPINKMLVEAVGSKEDITGKSFSRMMEENGVSTKKESRDVRKSNEYAKDSENPFRNSDKPKLTADSFSSEDWKKISEMESGNSIMSQLRNSHQTPFSAKYVNGEPVIPKKERNALAEQKPSSKSLTSSAEHSPQTVRKESSKPPELPPRSQAASEAFYHPKLKDSGHYRSESYDLDLRTNNKVGFPAKRADVPSESNSTSNHTRAHSFTSGYYPPAPYGVVPSEPPRCTSIPEEQTSDAADVPPPLPPRNIDRRSSDVVRSIGSTEELSKARSDRERRVSDPRQPESVRRSSSSRHSDPRMYWAQHQYSKSDSEKYQRVSSSDSWHKMSDPSGAIRKSHKVSDPDEKRKVQEALRKFYHEKTSSQDSGVGGSRPSSICDYGDHYSSMSSIPSTRPGSVPADTLSQYHRQSVFSSQTSLSSTSSICRDSGISSPNPANWAQHSPPQIANIPSPEYDRHHPPMRYSTSALPDTHHGQYDHRNPPWLSNELQQGRKSTPVTRSSSMSVKLDQRRSYEGNVGLSRTDSFTAYKTRPESANADSHRARSGSDGQQEKRKRRSREERKSREEMHSREERIRLPSEKTVEELPKRKWTPPKQSPLTFSTKDQTEPPLSETQTQVQQAERKPISTVDKDDLLRFDEDDEELVQVEESVIAQKASQQNAAVPLSSSLSSSMELLRKKEEPAPIFRFPSPPPVPERNRRSVESNKEPISLPSPPASPPSTQLAKTSPQPPHYNFQAAQKKALCQVDSFVLPPPPSPSREGSIYLEQDMDFPPPPPEVLGDMSQYTPTEGRITPPLLGQHTQEAVMIEEPVYRKQADKLESTPNSHLTRPVDLTPSSSPQSSVISSVSREPALPKEEDKPEFYAPHALQEDSDIDSDTVESASKSVDLVNGVDGERTASPKRTESPASPIFIPDDVSETKHEVQVIERPTELPLLTPSPRRPSEPFELSNEHSPDDSRQRSPSLGSPRDTLPSSDSGIGIVDFVIKSLTPCECSDLIDLFPESDRKSEKKNKMPNAGEKSISKTPKKPDHVDGPPIQTVIPSSLYLQLSPGKALLLTRAKGMQGTDKNEIGEDNAELRKTKEELVIRITRKVEELKSMHKEVQEEITTIEGIGKQVSEQAKESCKASEFNKYTMYVEDVDRVSKLLLSLSRRLTKVDSVLSSLDNHDEEQNADLQTMKQNLERKYNDAKMLKKSIDMRHNSISKMLKKYLGEEEYEDFCHFIRESPRQHIMAQELDDKIQLGEEQLQALTDSLRKTDLSQS